MTDANAIFPDAIGRLLRREELPAEVAERALGAILAGEATDAQIAGFAVALRAKGETATELAALVRTMLAFSDHVEVGEGAPLIDTCGTGGDRSGTVNVSTMAALVAAGAGARVAKHGNRAQSSNCGSADVLEALGVVIDLGPSGVARCIDEAGIGFCLAPRYHPALRFAGPVHAASSASPPRSTSSARWRTPPACGASRSASRTRRWPNGSSPRSRELGSVHALVFHGHDGLDELTTTGPSTVYELRDGSVRQFDVDLDELGIRRAELADLAGGDAATNAEIVRRTLAGGGGPVRDIVALNAGAALVVAGLADDLGGGVELARVALDDGRAAATLDAFVRASGAARLAED